MHYPLSKIGYALSTTNTCDICAMYVHRVLGPVVAIWSSQVDLLWARSSKF